MHSRSEAFRKVSCPPERSNKLANTPDLLIFTEATSNSCATASEEAIADHKSNKPMNTIPFPEVVRVICQIILRDGGPVKSVHPLHSMRAAAAQSESSQANRSASLFHLGGFAGRSLGSTCSSAFRFVSRFACA